MNNINLPDNGIKKVLHIILRSRLGVKFVFKLYGFLERRLKEWEFELASKISPECRVIRGPFRGLDYSRVSDIEGSSYLPKILGSYEEELHEIFEELRSRHNYKLVINIGCGEGYYAVGVAKTIPTAKILAYDLNPKSRELCENLAKVNGVLSRISIQKGCGEENLRSLEERERSLILCDCEGFEYVLLKPRNLSRLSRFDLIMEIHEDRAEGPKVKALADQFAESHRIKWIRGTKRVSSGYSELEGMPKGEADYVIDEKRPCLMDWLILEDKRS